MDSKNQNGSAFSRTEMRIYDTYIEFNLSTASELHYPELITMWAVDEGKSIYIQPCTAHSQLVKSAFQFYDRKANPAPQQIRIDYERFVQGLRNDRGWGKDGLCWVVCGTYLPELDMLQFNLLDAVIDQTSL